MTHILAALPLFLLTCAAYADVAPEPPAESNMIGTIVFLLIFVGACAAVAWLIWKSEKKPKQTPGQH
jgi:heme A synthase